MKALVVKVKYIADHDEAKEPVVMIQVPKNLIGRNASKDNEFPQGIHLNRLRLAFEPLRVSAPKDVLRLETRRR